MKKIIKPDFTKQRLSDFHVLKRDLGIVSINKNKKIEFQPTLTNGWKLIVWKKFQ
jgi:hypothetical protein